jgi:hypothetical protein
VEELMTRKCKNLKMLFATVLCAVASCQLSLVAQAQETILDIQGENTVSYFHDIWDYPKIASDPGITTALRPIKPFQSFTDITDIVAVNGQPAKGTWITRGDPQLGLDPNAVHGAAMPRAIADVTRSGIVHDYLEILQPDGTPIGTIMLSGMNMGSPPPGAPVTVTLGNRVVTGGTGAFLGARGQAGNAVSTFRVASISEDPADRRINGGGPKRLIIHLIPMSRPEVVITPSGPAVTHSNDFTLVTSSKPAATGETLSLFATGVGPTRPGVDPGQPFPSSPLAVVNSPVVVTVNGKPAEVLAAVGFPNAVNGYQVNFRVPPDTSKGTAMVQVSAAWVAGPVVSITVQ